MIVFGWNSFLLHKCKPSQLGLAQELDTVYQIERRQKYFHLFYIPFFGTGKIWALRKRTDNQLYEPNGEFLKILEALPYKEKTPWYTFALALLLLAGGIGFLIVTSFDDYQRHKEYKKMDTERAAMVANAVNTPTVNMYYTLRNEDNYYSYLKVLSSNATTITCLLTNPTSDFGSIDDRILEAFAENASIDTVVINKQNLLKTINPGRENDFEGDEFIDGKGMAVLAEVKTIDSPVFRKTLVQFEKGLYKAMLQNIGATVKLKNFTAGESNVIFEGDALPDEIATGQSFIINGKYEGMEPKANATIQFETAGNVVKDFQFQIRGTDISFNKTNE